MKLYKVASTCFSFIIWFKSTQCRVKPKLPLCTAETEPLTAHRQGLVSDTVPGGHPASAPCSQEPARRRRWKFSRIVRSPVLCSRRNRRRQQSERLAPARPRKNPQGVKVAETCRVQGKGNGCGGEPDQQLHRGWTHPHSRARGRGRLKEHSPGTQSRDTEPTRE